MTGQRKDRGKMTGLRKIETNMTGQRKIETNMTGQRKSTYWRLDSGQGSKRNREEL